MSNFNAYRYCQVAARLDVRSPTEFRAARCREGRDHYLEASIARSMRIISDGVEQATAQFLGMPTTPQNLEHMAITLSHFVGANTYITI